MLAPFLSTFTKFHLLDTISDHDRYFVEIIVMFGNIVKFFSATGRYILLISKGKFFYEQTVLYMNIYSSYMNYPQIS